MRILCTLALLALVASSADTQEVRSTAAVTGVVLDSAQRPIEQAEVSIAALSLSTRTDSTGRFLLAGVAPGIRTVSARRVGFEPGELRVALRAGETMEIDFVLRGGTVRLEEVRVEAHALIPSFEEHRSRGLGSFLTRADLEPQENRRLAEVLRQLRGVNIQHGRGSISWLRTSRVAQSRSIAQGRERFRRDEADLRDGAQHGVCYAQVYLDNQLVYRGQEHEPLFNLNSIQVHQIEAIEFYAGPAQLPMRFSGLDSPCGVLVIHTRRSLPPPTPPAQRP